MFFVKFIKIHSIRAPMMAEVSKELERLRDLFYGLAELRDRLRGDGATWPWSLLDADAKPLGPLPHGRYGAVYAAVVPRHMVATAFHRLLLVLARR